MSRPSRSRARPSPLDASGSAEGAGWFAMKADGGACAATCTRSRAGADTCVAAEPAIFGVWGGIAGLTASTIFGASEADGAVTVSTIRGSSGDAGGLTLSTMLGTSGANVEAGGAATGLTGDSFGGCTDAG